MNFNEASSESFFKKITLQFTILCSKLVIYLIKCFRTNLTDFEDTKLSLQFSALLLVDRFLEAPHHSKTQTYF